MIPDNPKELKQRLSLIAKNTEENYVLIDTNFNIITFNDQFKSNYLQLFGVNISKGDSILTPTNLSINKTFRETYEKVFAGEIQESEISIPVLDSSTRTFYVKRKPVYKDDNGIFGAFISAIEITKRKLVQEQLRQTQERLRIIIDNEPECIKVVDKSGNLIDMNFAGLQMVEAETLSEVKGKSVVDLIHPEDRKIYIKLHEQVIKGEKGNSSFRIIGLRKKQSWTESVGVPLKNSKGEIFAALSVTRDITEQKNAEAERETEKKNREALINTTTDWIWSLTKGFHLIAANKSFLATINKSTGLNIKTGDYLLLEKYYPKEIILFWKELYLLALSGETFKKEIRFEGLVNTPQEWAEISFHPIYEEVEITGIACYGRNITEKKKQEQELKQLNKEVTDKSQELATSNHGLEQFAYITSHNLRAPLSNLLGLLSLVDDISIEDKNLKEILNGIKTSTNHLNQTIEDLIKILIIKDNRTLPVEEVSIEATIVKVLEQTKNLALEINPKIYFNFELMPTVYFNPTYLESIFLNLITNAFKYRDKNRDLEISIMSKIVNSHAQIEFQDNGIGINLLRHKDRIFGLYQRFTKVNDGKGLGLYLVKSQLAALGASIQVESELDRGTKFILKFQRKINDESSSLH